MVSETESTRQRHSLHRISGHGEEIAELREETNIKFEKLKQMLEEINRQLKISARNEDSV